ncbi:MAG: DUF924 family protein [bacterium]|nr:DUF924 domain-containing protein [Gammaproteobacteria bacterium]
MNEIEELLQFWIGPASTDPIESSKRTKLWYGSNPATDNKIRLLFSETLKRAERGELTDWANTDQGSLALIILLDQFSRHIYRGSADAFANDNRALEVARTAIDKRRDQRLSLIERAFMYHPFHHAESLPCQNQCVTLFENLESVAPRASARQISSFANSARGHREIIRRFGRFPHRNDVLRRESSSDEIAYLKRDGKGFGQ